MSLSALPGAHQEREPTELQLHILRFVADFIRRWKYSPAFHEVPTTRATLVTLQRNGWLGWKFADKVSTRPREGRTLHLTDAGEALLTKHEVRDV